MTSLCTSVPTDSVYGVVLNAIILFYTKGVNNKVQKRLNSYVQNGKIGKVKDLYKNKKVLIFGLGLNDGGLGMTEFFANQGALVTVTDNKSTSDLQTTLSKLSHYPNIKYHLGEIHESDFTENDIIVQNPAIKSDNKYIALARSLNKTIEMEMSLFHKLCPCPIIGITGTRGKSTTSALTYEFLKKEYGDRVVLGGNIGKSAIRELPNLTKDNIVVLELSSFQLATMGKSGVSPSVSLITNMYPDHLNWHSDMDDYISAKKNIFLHQKTVDTTILNFDNEITNAFTHEIKSKLVTYSLKVSKADYYLADNNFVYERGSLLLDTSKSLLTGAHNKYNILAAISLARHFDVSVSSILDVLMSYAGLEGRQQLVRDVNGVKYFNDTTATSVEAMLALFERFAHDYNKRMILISGGVDKGLDYSRVSQLLTKHCKALVLFEGTASEKIASSVEGSNLSVEKYFNTMNDAVTRASSLAISGDAVILCPGAASFNMFKNEFDRGEQFDEAVKSL